MKIYIVILLLIANSNYLCCQNTELDSILNDYSRQFRTELNKSDTILIHSLLVQIKGKCSSYDSLITSREYSNVFVEELTKQVANANCCNSNIIDNISYFSPIAGEVLLPTSYPVFNAVFESENAKAKLKKFILSSEYASNCFFISEKKPFFLLYLSRLIFEDESENEIFDFQNKCKNANLKLLQLIYLSTEN